MLYQGHKVVPHCPRCGTALSSHEVAQGYEKVTEKNSAFVKFKVRSNKGKVKKGDYILSWTTTPWTLPGNVALAVNSDIDYVRVQIPKRDQTKKVLIELGAIQYDHVILAKSIFEELYDKDSSDELKIALGLSFLDVQPEDTKEVIKSIQQTIKGLELIGLEYEPPYQDAIPKQAEGYQNAFKVYPADFVTTNEGTGVVHTAVMYGEDDYRLGEKAGLPKVHTIAPDGTFSTYVPKWLGRFVKDAIVESEIIKDLENRELLLTKQSYTHDYPFCWRCHTPLLYYAKTAWFIKMSALKEKLKSSNDKIKWIPEHIQHGRFGEWLNEIKDWAISRERYWGTPLPIWICEKDHQHQVCIGSLKELRENANIALPLNFDPHRPFIDSVRLKCPKCNSSMRRVKEVCDTWFDSGSMPFAQWHYPFENKERIDKGVSYPADYIAEAIDQTRGWFYTLLAVATLLDKGAPYKNVICLGHILDAKGQKMSKSKGNVVDPWSVIEQYGADALRFHLFSINQPGEYKLFDPKQVGDCLRQNFMILWNVVSFWEQFKPTNAVEPIDHKKRSKLDQWQLARLNQLVEDVTTSLESYQITDASRSISEFITELSTWYVRRSRARFKTDGADRDAAYQTLTESLFTLTKLMAPLTPLVADALYQRLGGQLESVHLEAWPKLESSRKSTVTSELIKQMETVRQIVELGHSLRAEAGVKVRQPLGQLVFTGVQLSEEFNSILLDELNVREAVEAKSLPRGDEWKQKESGELVVALDITITDELREAGWVREVIRRVNDERKRLGLKRTDSVSIGYQTADETARGFFERYGAEVGQAGNAKKIEPAEPGQTGGAEFKLAEHRLALFVQPDIR
ncbi:MAG: Isoleucine-tRNA ligase [Candidatus Giovannonibacteria bacterium GW2011_GWA2_53_7]|uniref:Isoleucine--tRNA ligase n=1 Tax=Candidatus Giovannonibacteria bacterium GW2011_GWA2_53_7 TaxID=1618650 RepID=A0A0G2APU3_9BACT|nr:MAG: Isoleucine-tRNA ligase [Candidatus Giovannonibacteria bacterium GW2011_GWA2_53_7]